MAHTFSIRKILSLKSGCFSKGEWRIMEPKSINTMKTNPTVVEYAVGRLADLGIGHAFGVAGDYAFPIDDAIEANDRLSYIGCSNELNAAYSADGYARVHHTFGDGNFEQFDGLSDISVCVSVHLTPENAIPEMERVISTVLSQRQPGYIQIPQDLADMPVVGEPIRGVPLAITPTFSS